MKTKILRNTLVSLGAIFTLAGLVLAIRTDAAPKSSLDYTFTTFNVPDEAPPSACFGGTVVYGINNRGNLVGVFGTQQQVPTGCNAGCQLNVGFLFAHDAFTDVSIPSSPIGYTDLIGINDHGDTVGNDRDCNFNSVQFLRTKDGKIQFLPPVATGAVGAGAIAINNAGTMAGSYFDANGSEHGFIFQGGVYTISAFDYPNAIITAFHGINDHGVIVGTFRYADNVAHGFVRSADGTLTTFDVPGAAGTFGRGINNDGTVVGHYIDANSVVHGFMLSKGVYTTLDVPGASDTFPEGINDRGEIVGGYNGETAGFIAKPVPGNSGK
jgi:uncharacterized membrane protein